MEGIPLSTGEAGAVFYPPHAVRGRESEENEDRI